MKFFAVPAYEKVELANSAGFIDTMKFWSADSKPDVLNCIVSDVGVFRDHPLFEQKQIFQHFQLYEQFQILTTLITIARENYDKHLILF